MTADESVVPPDADDVALWVLMSEYNWDEG